MTDLEEEEKDMAEDVGSSTSLEESMPKVKSVSCRYLHITTNAGQWSSPPHSLFPLEHTSALGGALTSNVFSGFCPSGDRVHVAFTQGTPSHAAIQQCSQQGIGCLITMDAPITRFLRWFNWYSELLALILSTLVTLS